jgi:hypothetical protein
MSGEMAGQPQGRQREEEEERRERDREDRDGALDVLGRDREPAVDQRQHEQAVSDPKPAEGSGEGRHERLARRSGPDRRHDEEDAGAAEDDRQRRTHRRLADVVDELKGEGDRADRQDRRGHQLRSPLSMIPP